MHFYEKNGIIPYINAHDTYTVYGGSRMADNTLQAMREAAENFVDIGQMQKVLGEKAARMTHNEAAFFTNGAAGALLLCACVCMAEDSEYLYRCLPENRGNKKDIILMRSQRNAYDTAVRMSGARIIEIGDADETLVSELEGNISEQTAAVFYFASSLYQRGSLSLKQTIETAGKYGVPVIVDAAAQLPPRDNLWKFTETGADMVIFSGGKTLCGPQDSGIVLGKKKWIDRCIRFGAPEHGICRVSKTSREAMAGLYTALENYMILDEGEEEQRRRKMIDLMNKKLCGCAYTAATEIVDRGPVGQTYSRLFCYIKDGKNAEDIVQRMKEQHIYIGCDKEKNAVYLSPLNLTEKESEKAAETLAAILGK